MTGPQDFRLLPQSSYNLHPDRQLDVRIVFGRGKSNRNGHCGLSSYVKNRSIYRETHARLHRLQGKTTLPVPRRNDRRSRHNYHIVLLKNRLVEISEPTADVHGFGIEIREL